jgi:hypothetical protein
VALLTGSIVPTLKVIKLLPFCLFTTDLPLEVSHPQPSRTFHRLGGITAANTRVISVSKDAVADILGRLCQWHRQLSEIVDMVAASYGPLLFVVITYCFANSVFGTYEIITQFHAPGSPVRIRPIIACVTCGCRLTLISVIPSMTAGQVSESLYFSLYVPIFELAVNPVGTFF